MCEQEEGEEEEREAHNTIRSILSTNDLCKGPKYKFAHFESFGLCFKTITD